MLRQPFALPRVDGSPQLYEQCGVVSALVATPQPVLVSQFARRAADTC